MKAAELKKVWAKFDVRKLWVRVATRPDADEYLKARGKSMVKEGSHE